MIYAEYVPNRPDHIRVYSNVDGHPELDKARCMVRAPSSALIPAKNTNERVHLLLFGQPKDRMLAYLPPDRVYATPVDRIEWEKDRPEINKRHPVPFVARE